MKKILISIYFCLALFVGLNAQSLEDTIIIDEVVVTGSKIEVSRKNLPVNVSVLKRSDINEVEESAVLPVISRKIPGIFVTERGVTGFGVGSSSAGLINVRGVGGSPNTRVLMLVDGQPQYMGIFGHPLPNSYVASDLERVEVIKGPGSILYGSNAMGGVVNFITKKQEKNGFSGNARFAYGSYNTQKYMINGGFKKDGLHLFASFNRDKTDGHRDSAEFEINNAYVKAGYEFNKNIEVIADYNIAKFSNADPGKVFDVVPAFRAEIIRGKTSFSIKNKFKGVEGGIYTFYNFGDHELSDGWLSNDENYGVSVYQGISLPWNTLLTIGADYKKFGGKGNSGMSANVWNVARETGIYAIVRHEIIKVLNISYGMRVENNSEYGNELVPQGGISWNATDVTTLKLSASKGFRSPTIMETYLFMPNPLLKPERMMNYEFNVTQQFMKGKLRADGSVFLIEGSNIIPPMKRVNIGEFSNKGFELEFNYFHGHALTSSLGYAFLDTKDPILAAPEHQINAGLNYKWSKLNFALQGNYVGGLYSYIHNPQNQTAADDLKENYFLLNASIKYKPLNFAEVFISVKNLFDQKYQIDYGYPMPGIHFMTGLNISF